MKNRRSCQKCRYNRCKAAGMDANAVLNEQQRQIRFRRVIERKNREQNRRESGTGSQSSPEQSRSNLFPPLPTLQPPNRWARILQPKVEKIIQTYRSARGQNSAASSDWIFEKVESVFLGESPEAIQPEDLLDGAKKMSDEFHKFASLQSHFQGMRSEDQKRLLDQNTPMYILFRVGLFLAENHVKEEEDDESEFLTPSSNFLNFLQVERQMGLFRPTTDWSDFQKLVDQLRCLRNAKCFDESAIIAYVLLFSFDETLQIEEKEIFEDVKLMNEIMFDSYITSSNSEFEVRDLIRVLREMGLFCTYNTEWEKLERQHRHFNISNIIMSYTMDEETWIVNQMKLVDQAFRSVPAGMDIINEFMMHCLGVPLSRTYMPSVLAMMMERIRRVLNIHPEFEEMSVASQRNILRINCGIGLALYVARSESLNGMEQIHEGMGELDVEMWNFHYGSIFDTQEKFTKVSITDLPLFGGSDLRLFNELLSETQILAKNKELFNINLLIALTEPCGDDESSKALSNLHFKYKTILKRRMKWRTDWTGLTSYSADPDFLFGKILSSHEKLKQLARLNEQIMNTI